MNKKKVFFLIGLPGSGKSTLSKYLCDNFKFSIVSSNSIVKENSYLNGNYLKNTYINRGISIPDDLYVYLVSKCLQKSLNDKFIIEGFPYNINQLKLAEKMLNQTSSELCGVIYLNENESVLYERLINRRVCPICNQSFGGKVEECPNCNVSTVKRNDDDLLIINKRLKEQKDNLLEVISYYQQKKILLETNSTKFNTIIENINNKVYIKKV